MLRPPQPTPRQQYTKVLGAVERDHTLYSIAKKTNQNPAEIWPLYPISSILHTNRKVTSAAGIS